MLRHWIFYRINESRGFISMRILDKALRMYEMLYGTSYCSFYDKGIQILQPEEVMMIYNDKGFI